MCLLRSPAGTALWEWQGLTCRMIYPQQPEHTCRESAIASLFHLLCVPGRIFGATLRHDVRKRRTSPEAQNPELSTPKPCPKLKVQTFLLVIFLFISIVDAMFSPKCNLTGFK